MGGSAMDNPRRYRDVMKAAFGYDERSVDEVIAEYKRLEDEAEAKRKREDAFGRVRTTSAGPTKAGVAQPKQVELDALAEMAAFARPLAAPLNLDEDVPPS